MLIIDPPATAGGTDIYPSEMLTFEAKEHTHYICLPRDVMVVVIDARQYEVVFLSFGIGSFEPLAPEPQVAHQLAKGAKEKRQTQGDEEYGEREDENRRDAAAFISPNRGPCCTT
jgi:hypothetical protein